MKYSILGFNQEIVCAIKKDVQTNNGNIKHLCLDVIDLLILKDVSDFMNRSKIIKLTIDDKIYFSITHKCILEDLPILGRKKQALKDRIDKMVQLGILDKKVVRDNGGTWVGYRITKVYEDLIYSNNNQEGVYPTTRGGCSELHEGGVVNYNPNNTITINNTTINNKEEDNNKLLSPKKESKRFVKPTIEQIQAYITEKGYTFDAEAFFAFYESNGWKVGKNPMKSWKAACTTWSKDRRNNSRYNNNNFNNYGRETITDKIRRTLEDSEQFQQKLDASIREADLGFEPTDEEW